MKKIISKSPQETQRVASKLSQQLKRGDILCLVGELGSGKTTFVKGLAKALGIKKDSVNSPTFVLMNHYEGSLPVYHFDLYRLNDETEMRLIGFDEFLYKDGITVVEWADKMGAMTPKEYLRIEFFHEDKDKRVLKIIPKGKRYESIGLSA